MKKLFLTFSAMIVFSIASQSQNGGVSVNSTGAVADPSAMLDVSSTTKGTLITRMTTAQRNAIASPAEGLMIYNLDCFNLNIFSNGAWVDVFQPAMPSTPVAGTHTPAQTQIIWNWNTVTGAAGYKWNTTNDYNTSTDLGNSNSVTQTNLLCNTFYTIYVWAYNLCSHSTAATLTQQTSNCPVFTCGSSTVTFTYNGNQVTYGTTQGTYNSGQYCWLDRNLGAAQAATSSTDYMAYGDMFQWGRGDDGHQVITWSSYNSGIVSNITTTLSTTNTPGHSYFISSGTNPNDWRSPQNTALWQGTNGANNPCPTGFRVPTDTEIDNERATFNPSNSSGAFASPLKLTTPGSRYYNSGALVEAGSQGYYWTSTINATGSRFMGVYPTQVYMGEHPRANAWTVRCIKD